MFTRTRSTPTHTHTRRCIMCVGNGILGNLIQVFPLWEGRKRKGKGNYSSQTKRKDRERNQSLPAVAAAVAVGSSASKRMHEMTDCALVRHSKDTRAPSCLALCTLIRQLRGRARCRSLQMTPNQKSLAQVGGLRSTFGNSRRPAEFRRQKGHLNKQLVKMQPPRHQACS